MTESKTPSKVLFTSHTANFSKFNRPFMRWFKKEGWDVHYASMGEEKVLDCDKHFKIPFARSPFSLDNLRAVSKLKKVLDENDYDIIHTHTPMGSVVTRIAARKTRRKNGTRVIYTAHGLHFFKGAPLINWLLYFPMEWLMSFITDDIILINKEDYERSKKHLHAKRTHWLKSGVGIDLSRFKPVSEKEKLALRKKYGYNKDDFIMIYIAEFINRKNHKFLIEVLPEIIKENKNAKLILLGKGEKMEEMKTLANELNVYKQIDFLGYQKNVEEYIKLSDLGVSASKQEGLATGLIEILACGVPVVASDIRGHREFLRGEQLFSDTNDLRVPTLIKNTFNNLDNFNSVDFNNSTAIKNMARIYKRGNKVIIKVGLL